LQLPKDLDGLLWKTLKVRHWPHGVSNDLESAASIPGSKDVLLVESGDSGKRRFQRIFLARVQGNHLDIKAFVRWPHRVYNVEATAVARKGNDYVFLYAERAQLEPETQLRWASFDPVNLTFGAFHSVTLVNPDPKRTNRPVVALDVDSRGKIYIATAFDPEAAKLPDPDNGPFASSVWLVGKVIRAQGGTPRVKLFNTPKRLATLDSLKVESISVRKLPGQDAEVFVGLDDENYGATLRKLPAPVN
jgi:hypothetical protein